MIVCLPILVAIRLAAHKLSERGVMEMGHVHYSDLLAYLGIGGAHPGGLAVTKELLLRETIDKHTHILEIGCGTGQTSFYISEIYRCHVTAIEKHPVMIEKASERFFTCSHPIHLIEGSAEELPLDERSFDFVLCESVLSFVDLTKVIPEVKRVLKDKGKLLAIEMTLDATLTEEEATRIQDFYQFNNMLTEQQWVEKLKELGHFTEIEAEQFQIQDDEDSLVEFSLSENLDPSLFDQLDEHERLLLEYQDKMGYRIFTCYY